LGAAFGIPELWVKRDELLGFGFGGNKVRALELFLADALAKGADTLVTGAGPQSNHVRVTAAAAAHAGLACEAFSWGPEPTSTAQGNLLLSRMLGARVHFTGDADRASVDRGIEAAMTRLRAAGRTPYAIPRGGASALGVLAHVLAVQEALAQTAARGVRPAAVVMAVGSGCTLAGWLLGRRLFGTSFLLEGIVVSRPARETRVRVVTLAAEAATLLGGDAAARLARTPFVDDELGLHDGFLGEGYGIPTIAGLAALRTAARCEGIFTDPTYTGKALAGLAALAHDKRLPTGPVLFLHTGGEPALFAHAEAIVHAEGA
ncbi:MAG: D-cysteine desulfhydrase, partial [Myxococcales bacterium]|nr:D-cysteine desulfhydrase [Myxococcales bacterium]